MNVSHEYQHELNIKLQQILIGVYSPVQLKALIPQIMTLLSQQVELKSRKTELDETDVIVITYGDSIINSGKSPLATLTEFVRGYLSEAVSAVHVLPCYPYTSDDGFSVVDYWAVNPNLGTWQDIEQLSQQYDVMLDGVINHISKSSAWFQGYLEGDKHYRGFFTQAEPNRDYSSVTRPRALPLLTPFETQMGLQYVWTTFSEDQIDLNYRNPDVFLKIVELLLFYTQRGARYIRLDAIGFMWKELDTSCIHLPQTHAIIQAFRAIFDFAAPHVKLITETNVPHADNVSYFGNGENEAHLVYQFPLPPLTLHTIQTGNSDKIVNWIQSLEPCTSKSAFFNFLASHDGIGVRPVEGILTAGEVEQLLEVVERNGGRVSYKDNGDGTQSPYELNINYFDAVKERDADEKTNVDRFIAAQAILLSLAGVPGIYIHSLIGSSNDYEGLERLGYNRAINREKLDLNVLEKELAIPYSQRAQVLSRLTHLLNIRKQCDAFSPSAHQRVVQTDQRLITLVRGERIAVVINISNQLVELSTDSMLPNIRRDLITGNQTSRQITLAPYQVMWLSQ